VGHWLGLAHTWAQTTTSDKEAACSASADYTSITRVMPGDSDAVRDTPPQATDSEDVAFYFRCTAGAGAAGSVTPKQSCTSEVNYLQGDKYFANIANHMVSIPGACRDGVRG
jgi:hypothetical protein